MNQNHTYHDLFDNFNEVSCYILGLWFADGWITYARRGDKAYKKWGIANTDKQIMMELKKIFGVNLSCRVRRREHKTFKPCYELRIYSDKLFDFCYNLVGSTRKSQVQFKLPQIPDCLYHHFVRGFFDGDGSIHWIYYKNRHGKPATTLRTSFTSGFKTTHLEQLRDKLTSIIGIGNRKIVGKKHKKLVYCQYDSMLLCRWMYSDATIYMKRKRDLWLELDIDRVIASVRFFSNKLVPTAGFEPASRSL